MRIDWNRWRVRLNYGGRVRCELGWSLDERWSQNMKDFDLWLVWGGRGHMRTHEGELELRPGVCLWVRPGGLYLAEQDPRNRLGVSYRHFSLVDTQGRTRPYDQPAPPLVHEILNLDYADGILRRVNELAGERAERSSRAAEMLLTGLLMDLDAESDRPGPARGGAAFHHRQMVLRWSSKIAENPREAPGVAAMAQESGYSTDHFARLFKEVLGLGPQDYVVRARLDRARFLLRNSPLSVGEIAEALGYSDVYFFSKQFKRKTGQSPSRYRAAPAAE
ncbi:MAG: helix-turn-helix transcriptional regulator [Planctomycetota bacterium]|nr:helix-turn-helix transcriptional regulator [Planctomycetota bacterium]